MIDSRPPLVDTHAHLQDPSFDHDRDAVYARAREAGLAAIVCVGWDLASSRQAVDLAARYDALWAAVGIHPNYAGRATEADWSALCDLARAERVVGLGETGLDNYRTYTEPAVQEAWFRRHLALGADLGLPVIVHNRQADQQVRTILGEWRAGGRGPRPGVMHCFSADRAMLEACLELGFTISFAGPVTFKNAASLREVARAVPTERLVVETDCPYLAPHPQRGARNEPAYLESTARALAEVRSEPFAELAEHTTRAAAALFGLGPAAAPGADTP